MKRSFMIDSLGRNIIIKGFVLNSEQNDNKSDAFTFKNRRYKKMYLKTFKKEPTHLSSVS